LMFCSNDDLLNTGVPWNFSLLPFLTLFSLFRNPTLVRWISDFLRARGTVPTG
jgi:hypothetical protein